MTKIEMRIMLRAVKIRMRRGEALEEILESWPALTEADRQYIREAVAA